MRDDRWLVWGSLAWTALVLVAVFFSPGYADGECVFDSCSDDTNGTLGNERLCWDGSVGATNYEIEADGTFCLAVLAPATCDTILPTCRGDALRIRACNQAGCSEWSASVEVLPYCCLRTATCQDGPLPRDVSCPACEYRCFPGAPLRMPTIPECPL